MQDETTPEAVQEALQEIELQRNHLINSFIPAFREKVVSFLESDEAGGFELGALAVALTTSFLSRIQSYAGGKWSLLNKLFGRKLDREQRRIYWARDFRADHCEDCLEFGEREYASFQDLLNQTGGISPASGTACQSRCRCSLLGESIDGWVRS